MKHYESITRITSAKNENVKLYTRLALQRKYRYEKGLFVIEGAKLLNEAAVEGVKIISVFFTEDFADKNENILSSFAPETNLYIVTDDVAQKLSDTQSPQGIFGVCKMPEMPKLSSVLSDGSRFILLTKLQDTGNMGTIIRTADALGIAAIICCGCCDIYNPKTVRGTMGSLFRVKIIVTDEDTAFDEFEIHNVKSFAAVPDSTACDIKHADFSEKSVVLIGNEGNGLDDDTINRCTEKITVKMKGRAESLNAAVAASIIMWEIT